MFTSKDDRLRHEILGRFYKSTTMVMVSGFGYTPMGYPIKQLAKELGVSEERISEVSHLLRAEDDIAIHLSELPNKKFETLLKSTPTTVSAYVRKKYLNYQWENLKKSSDFWLKLTAVASLGLSVFTTINTCNKSRDSTQDIERLRQQVNELSRKANPLPQSRIQPVLSPLKDSLHR